jgi:cytochrome o ubiquinol oxidase subunit 2
MHRALDSLGRSRRSSVGRLSASVPLILLLTGCAGGPLDPQGPVADNIKIILIDSTVIMLAIVIPTILAAAGLAWWYRASNTRATYHPEWAYSGRIELIVWSIPIFTILFISGVIWIGSHKLDPAAPLPSTDPPVEVQVVSLDWKWLFIYPHEGIATVNQLVIPAGRPVHFQLTSGSVMNVFFVPQLGSMIYTMNSMVTQLHLQADHPGVFYGRSAQFSGDGFPDMHFLVHSVPPAEYAAWAARTHAAGPVLDMPAYTELLKQSTNVKPYSYRAVDPGLFQAITTRMAPLGPGPQTGRGGPEVSPRRAG